MKKEMKVVFCVLIFSWTALAAEPACPLCSKFHFEEMLLERVLRNELALEQTLKDIKDTHTKVVDALKKLQDEHDKVNTSIESMKSKQILMEATLDDVIITALANVSQSLSHILTESGRAIKEMEGRVERFKEKLQFRARISSPKTEFRRGAIVLFTQVDVNESQDYDNQTGKFVASVAGLYNFAVYHCNTYQKTMPVNILHNGKSLLYSFQMEADGTHLCFLYKANIVVSKGDIVWVQAADNIIMGDSDYPDTFSATMMYK